MYTAEVKHTNLISKAICQEISDFLEEQVFMGGFFTPDDREHTCVYIAYWLDTLVDAGKITRHAVNIEVPRMVDHGSSEYAITVKFKQKNCLVDTTVELRVKYDTLDDFIY